ncbi:MAG TPA: site-specific integrase [Nitrososphaeraceae archaeon]
MYHPDIESIKRPRPSIFENIPLLKRKEQSSYKPSDLWTEQDDLLFLNYCPSRRDRCYHMISKDTSCRPHEILKLKIKDLVFKTSENTQYAEVLVCGKTGSRHIPLINSILYIKDWLDEHPQKGNINSPLICGLGKSLGRCIQSFTLDAIYDNYKTILFPKLLEDPNISQGDKQKIRELLKKPWNPYIRRHSALTQKSKFLKEHVLRQHAGWSGRSQMHLKYLHYYGNESNESILEAYGIIIKDQKLSDTLRPKQCPNCNEPNKPDSKFCAKCRMVLTYDAYNETLEKEQEKETEVQKLKVEYEKNMKAMREEMNQQFTQIISMMQQYPQLTNIKPELTTTAQITLPDIQLKYADRVFRLYVKSLGDKPVLRAEELLNLKQILPEALDCIVNPNKSLHEKLDLLLLRTLHSDRKSE